MSEPVSVRRREECSVRLDDEATEVLNDLNKELCSEKTLAIPRELVKDFDRPFI